MRVNRQFIKISLLAFFFLMVILFWFVYLRYRINLQMLQDHAFQFKEFLHRHYAQSVFVFILFFIAIALMGLPLISLFSLVSGYLFGTVPGALYTNIGATIGGFCFFLMVRYAIGGYFQKKFAKQLAHFNQQVKEKGWFYLICIRFVPIIPFFVINACAALTKVDYWTFIWTTSIGIIPTTLIHAYAGKQFTQIHSLQDIFSFQILGAWALLILGAVVPLIVMRYYKRN